MSKYTKEDLTVLFEELRSYQHEQQWLEFKDALADPEKIGKTVSALANSACVADRAFGYLLWGVHDKTHELTDTDFDPETEKVSNQSFRLWLKGLLAPELAFEFYSFKIDGRRVVLLEIEAAYRMPVAFKNTEYIRLGEAVTELRKHPKYTAEIYRRVGNDWTAGKIPSATCDDLDPEALAFARKQYAEKHKTDSFSSEIREWDTMMFLHKARLAIEGKLTPTAILLLGKPESSHWLKPAVPRITWNLIGPNGDSLDYRHFDPPFLLAVDKVFAKIRNVTLRTMPDGTLFPVEVNQYDSWVFREALHNCIAHQDYMLCHTTQVTEYPDRLVFANAGAFRPGTLENALHETGRPRYYPNRQLADAMVELGMIDTIGSGIRRMFTSQQKRFMPMPDFDIGVQEVKVVLFGRILDSRYSLLLMKQADIPLEHIILLDKVQKKIRISREDAVSLKKRKLVEGRYPNLFPAMRVAEETQNIADYLAAKAYDDQFYVQKVLEFICSKRVASRREISSLLKKHLSSVLTEKQKEAKIGRLLSIKMGFRDKLITNMGSRKNPEWVLTDRGLACCRRENPKCRKACKSGK